MIGLLAGIALISCAIYTAIRPYLAVHPRSLMPDSSGDLERHDGFAGAAGGDSSGCGGVGDGACH